MAVFEPVRIELPDPSLVVLVGASGSGKSYLRGAALRPDRGDLLGLLPRPRRRRRKRPGGDGRRLRRAATSSPASGSPRPRLTVVDATNVQPERPQAAVGAGPRATTCFAVGDRPRPAGVGLPGPQPRPCRPRLRPARGPPAALAAAQASLKRLQREGFRRVWTLRSPQEVEEARAAADAAVERPPRRARPLRRDRRRPRLPRRAGRAAGEARLRGGGGRDDGDPAAGADRDLRRRLLRPRPGHARRSCAWRCRWPPPATRSACRATTTSSWRASWAGATSRSPTASTRPWRSWRRSRRRSARRPPSSCGSWSATWCSTTASWSSPTPA